MFKRYLGEGLPSYCELQAAADCGEVKQSIAPKKPAPTALEESIEVACR